jgi:hypothetical protein
MRLIVANQVSEWGKWKAVFYTGQCISNCPLLQRTHACIPIPSMKRGETGRVSPSDYYTCHQF